MIVAGGAGAKVGTESPAEGINRGKAELLGYIGDTVLSQKLCCRLHSFAVVVADDRFAICLLKQTFYVIFTVAEHLLQRGQGDIMLEIGINIGLDLLGCIGCRGGEGLNFGSVFLQNHLHDPKHLNPTMQGMNVLCEDNLVKGLQEGLSVTDGDKGGDRQFRKHILPNKAAVMGRQGVIILIADIDFFAYAVKAQIKMNVGL